MRSNVISSQEAHGRFGGVVPEIASRHHLELVNLIVEQALQRAGVTLADVEVVEVIDSHRARGGLKTFYFLRGHQPVPLHGEMSKTSARVRRAEDLPQPI